MLADEDVSAAGLFKKMKKELTIEKKEETAMKFAVSREIFEKMPTVCFGVVAAHGIGNGAPVPAIDAMLEAGIEGAAARFVGRKVKEEADILPYREAFRALGINPNKYMCSIEALFTRIAKGKGMPHIDPIVDLGNAVSLKYTLPIGAHDLGRSAEDICVRPAVAGDTFLPFGAEEEEMPEAGEVVYAVGHEVRTRRWTWRQSEHGKIGPETSHVFYPIDGFTDFNKDRVLAARDELAACIEKFWGCQVTVGFVDAAHPETEL